MTPASAFSVAASGSSGGVRLGVNLDHVATLRNARDEGRPDLMRALEEALHAGADGITLHLREDRRHIRDADLEAVAERLGDGAVPLNMEMAATEEMLGIARRLRPVRACVVPERRAERTTEHGLDACGALATLRPHCDSLAEAGISVSLFLDPSPAQLEAAATLGVPAVEVHTGTWCRAVFEGRAADATREWQRLAEAGAQCADLGLEFHAGHGLDYETAARAATLRNLAEVNIGHFLIGEALFVGFGEALRRMRAALVRGRGEALAERSP